MKHLFYLLLIAVVVVAISQANDFRFYMINQTSMNACTVDVDCD